jgi:hypothetical protein
MPFSETFGQELHCRGCWKYIGPSGKQVPYGDDGDAIEWVECERCLMRRLEQEATEEGKRRREEQRVRPRECELCGELFMATTAWQRFCCDEHRWVAHRRVKAAASVVRTKGEAGLPVQGGSGVRRGG